MDGCDANMLEAVVDVEAEHGSPTEIAELSEEDLMPGKHVKLEKRKRGDPRDRPVPGDDDADLDSPSKRPPRSEPALTASDIKELLSGHVLEMKAAWRTFQGRLDHLEGVQEKQGEAIDHYGEKLGQLRTRTKVIEKDMVTHRQTQQQTTKHLDELTEEVKNLKVQWDDMQGKLSDGKGPLPGAPSVAAGAPDPWAAYLRQRDAQQPQQAPGSGSTSSNPTDKGDVLTEDEKRTLVIGGWLRDTRKAVIEEEFAQILDVEEIKSFVDADRLIVYGPRRSVGMLKFVLREGETQEGMRNRMWGMIKALAGRKHLLASTKEGESQKTMWASFVKTKAARTKSALVSMVRRVTITLALDAKDGQGGIPCIANTDISAYDCDWNLGTIWCGLQKLASATHKPPREGEHILMSGGWVSLSAVALSAGCSIDEAKLAFEREL